MQRNLVTMRFFETYYYANIIHNVLTEPFEYLRWLNAWHEDREEALVLSPFPKWTVLHDFIAHVIQSLVDEEITDIEVDAIVHDKTAKLWVDQALRHHGLECPGFRSWLREQGIALDDLNEDHIAEYQAELSLAGDLDGLVEQLTYEVFFVVFGNRGLLCRLNEYIADVVVPGLDLDTVSPELQGCLAGKGRLRRAHIPEWAKNAVFFRDRGMCVQCLANLSGLLTAQTDDNFDHIVPLKEGGINDVTNLQLLCGVCNKRKGGRRAEVSNRYESWY